MNQQEKERINALVRKDPRELDLHDIKDILDSYVELNIDAWQAMDFMDKEEKNLFSKLRKEARENLISAGNKPTESLLEDIVRTHTDWLKHMEEEKKIDRAGKLFRETYKKWERTYTARMMFESANKKSIII